MNYIIKNATLVNEGKSFMASVVISGDTIEKITQSIDTDSDYPGYEVIDAEGLFTDHRLAMLHCQHHMLIMERMGRCHIDQFHLGEGIGDAAQSGHDVGHGLTVILTAVAGDQNDLPVGIGGGIIIPSYTGKSISDIGISVDNHLIAFAAEKARAEMTVVDMDEYIASLE